MDTNTNNPVVEPVSKIEVVVIEAEDKMSSVEDALELLQRYGRIDGKELIELYLNLLKAKGKYLREMPLAEIRTMSVEADKQVSQMSSSQEPLTVTMETEYGQLQVKPELVWFGGLDASKPVTEAEPRVHLVLPFMKVNMAGAVGVLIDQAAFDTWLATVRSLRV